MSDSECGSNKDPSSETPGRPNRFPIHLVALTQGPREHAQRGERHGPGAGLLLLLSDAHDLTPWESSRETPLRDDQVDPRLLSPSGADYAEALSMRSSGVAGAFFSTVKTHPRRSRWIRDPWRIAMEPRVALMAPESPEA